MKNTEVFSGFILFSSSLSSLSGTERLTEKIHGLTSLPVVSIAAELKDYASVVIDNKSGFEELVEHMIIHHGYRDIAYISGPLKNSEGLQRWEILKGICAKHRIEIPATHFYEGNFAMNSGTAAMKWFLDESKIMPEAIIAANDNMAIGAWEVMKRRNIQVPKQIAITGFDDLQLSESFDLPFTTVKQPLFKQGYEAAETLCRLIRGKKTERFISLPSEMVYRFSCGCLTGKKQADNTVPVKQENKDGEFIRDGLKQFSTAVDRELQGMKGTPIIRAWNKIILSAIENEIRESKLFDLIDEIQNEYRKSHYSQNQQSVVLSFINQMKNMTNEFYIQSDLLKRIVIQASDQEIINNIENIGVGGEDNPTLKDQISTIRQTLQITYTELCFISLFNHYAYKQNGSSKLIYASENSQDVEIPSGSSSFPTKALLHPDFLPKERFELLFELLFDYESVFGLVGLDMKSRGPNVFEMVRIRLSGVIRDHLARQQLVDLNRQLQNEVKIRQETERQLQQALNALQDLSLTDELTGLYNRRGFITMGEQQLKYCQRENEAYIVFFIDMDGLKRINDQFGHNEGDKAIQLTSEILKKSFRETDIIARLGGDEFTIFAAKADEESVQIIKNRIQNNVDVANAQNNSGYTVSMSLGTFISTSTDHTRELTLDEMLQEADQELYKVKRSKKQTGK